jgi:hypothetical protein
MMGVFLLCLREEEWVLMLTEGAVENVVVGVRASMNCSATSTRFFALSLFQSHDFCEFRG